MKVFAYYRTSTEKQVGNWKSQQLACKELATKKDLLIIEEFIEKKSAFEERPKFEEMLFRLTEVEGIVCFDLDRVVRSPFQLNKVLTVFQDTNKKIFQVTGELNLDEASDVLLARIKTDVANYERDMIIQRQKAGIKRFKKEKGYWGRPRAKISKYMFEKYIENGVLIFPKTTIAKLFGIHKDTLLKWMKENGYSHLIEEKPEWLE